MRTLHVDTGREMRGGQWQILYLLEGLLAKRSQEDSLQDDKPQDVTLLAPRASPLFEAAQKKGIPVQPLSFFALLKMARKADLVHVHDAHAHTLAALAGTGPLIVSRRVGFPVNSGIASLWKYSRGTRYLAVSRFVERQLLRAGVASGRIRVVYDGVPIPPESRRESRRVIALASKRVSIPTISVDLVRDLWEGLSDASVFVYKSGMEGLGSAALAAQAAGVPVVASAAGGLPEAILHGKTGFIVIGGDFTTPVRRLLSDPELAESMSRAARERAQKEFSIEVMVRNTLAAYKEVFG